MKMNKKNLRTAMDYLGSGNLKAGFDMLIFDETTNNLGYGRTTCGSVGCVIGHMTYAGFEKFENEKWLKYSERIFGINSPSKEWSWCFCGYWSSTDNTPEGAAGRIEWMLEHGVPDNWIDQMHGIAPLCYNSKI